MKKDKTEEEENGFKLITHSAGKYMRENYPAIILFVITFAATLAMSFLRIATSNTISSYVLEDYEIGQIADRTIYAQKSLPADYINPVSVEKGEKITRKGFPITEENYAKLKKMSESPVYMDYRAFADSALFLLLLGALFFFLLSSVSLGRKAEFKELLMHSVSFLLVYGITVLGSKSNAFSSPFALPVIIPISFCSFLIAILFGQLSALFFSVGTAFGVLSACAYQLAPFVFALASSLAAARIVRRIQRRIDMVFASIMLSLLDVVFLAAIKIIFTDSFSDAMFAFPGVAFNGFLSGILTLGFLTPLESVLNTASVFRLMDLSDTNNSLMKKMLVSAGGTYNHSMVVASLAETACREIGANALLARVGAYYHDIGKLDQPEYFVENQHGGENLHNELNPSLSVSIIRSHVKKGIEKAHALRLPPQVIDIIAEHHGNQVIAYFYNEAHKKDASIIPGDCSYTGNPPSTKESAVVMLADTVEAACRTLDKPSVPRLDKFIQTLFTSKVEHHQLDNCDLTFRELDIIHDTFVDYLASYYHSRIEYPDQKEPGEQQVLGDKTLSEAKGENPPSAENTKKSAEVKKTSEPKKTAEPKKAVEVKIKEKSNDK